MTAAEATSTAPERLAINLMLVFFSKEQMANGNCTPAPNRQQLDPNVIQGIRLHIQYKFPVPPEQEAARWSKILHQNMNAKCRNVRAAAKPKVTPETGIVVHADA